MTHMVKSSQVFRNAWSKVENQDLSFEVALREAWEEYRLQKLIGLLRAGMVTVTYRNHAGQVITRLATRSAEWIPVEKQPRQPAREEQYIAAVPYYSLTDQCWKMVEAQYLVSFQPVTIQRNEQLHGLQTVAA